MLEADLWGNFSSRALCGNLILLTAKIRHMERFHYRLWRTNKPLLKLFHGWDTPKEPGETKFFPSKNIEKYRNSKEKR